MIEPVCDLDLEWGRAGPMLEPAMKYTPFYGVDELYRDLKARIRSLWKINDRAYMVTVVSGDHLVVEYLGGEDVSAWIDDVRDKLSEIARSAGCVGVGLFGRKGWAKHIRAQSMKTGKPISSTDMTALYWEA